MEEKEKDRISKVIDLLDVFRTVGVLLEISIGLAFIFTSVSPMSVAILSVFILILIIVIQSIILETFVTMLHGLKEIQESNEKNTQYIHRLQQDMNKVKFDVKEDKG